jgi:alpha-1,2-mannosyltransferase
MVISRKWVWTLIVTVLCLFTVFLIRYSQRAPKRHYCDFRVYHDAGARFLRHENIYTRPDEAITPFKYSPSFAMMFAPLSGIDRFDASLIFFTLNFLWMAMVVVLSGKIAGLEALAPPQRVWAYILSLLCVGRFILVVTDEGQVTILMFLLTLLSVWAAEKRKNALAGFCLAAAMLIKYTPAIFIPYFLVRRRWSAAAWTFIGLALLVLLPVVFLGLPTYKTYMTSWFPYIRETSLDMASYFDSKNQSIYSMVIRLITMGTESGMSWMRMNMEQAKVIGTWVGLGLFAFALGPVVLRRRRETVAEDTAMLLILMALLNPNAWLTNFVVMFFGFLVIWKRVFLVRPLDKISLAAAVIAFILALLPAESLLGEDWQKTFEMWSLVPFASLVLFAALWRVRCRALLSKNIPAGI